MSQYSVETNVEERYGASIIERIQAREAEIVLSSRLIAGLISGVILTVCACFRDIQFLGSHPLLISGGIGFLLGAWLGERIVFPAIGILPANVSFRTDAVDRSRTSEKGSDCDWDPNSPEIRSILGLPRIVVARVSYWRW